MDISTAISRWLEDKGDGLSSSSISDIDTIRVIADDLGLGSKKFSALKSKQRSRLARVASKETGLKPSAIREFITIIRTWAEEQDQPEPKDQEQDQPESVEDPKETTTEEETEAEPEDEESEGQEPEDEESEDEAGESLGAFSSETTEIRDHDSEPDDADTDDADTDDADEGDDSEPSIVPMAISIFDSPEDSPKDSPEDDTAERAEQTSSSAAEHSESSAFNDSINNLDTTGSSFLKALETTTIGDETIEVGALEAAQVASAEAAAAEVAPEEPKKRQGFDYITTLYFVISFIALCFAIYFFLNAQQ